MPPRKSNPFQQSHSYAYLCAHSSLPIFKVGKSDVPVARLKGIGMSNFDITTLSVLQTTSSRQAEELEKALIARLKELPYSNPHRPNMLSGKTEFFPAACLAHLPEILDELHKVIAFHRIPNYYQAAISMTPDEKEVPWTLQHLAGDIRRDVGQAAVLDNAMADLLEVTTDLEIWTRPDTDRRVTLVRGRSLKTDACFRHVDQIGDRFSKKARWSQVALRSVLTFERASDARGSNLWEMEFLFPLDAPATPPDQRAQAIEDIYASLIARIRSLPNRPRIPGDEIRLKLRRN